MFRLLAVKLSLFFLTLLTYIPVWIISLLVSSHNRAYFWRWCSIVIIRLSMFSGGVKIHRANSTFMDSPCIYTSNHPSEMDGFVLQVVLGANAIPIIAPLEQFPWIIARWLSKMGAIDVTRDDIDQALYKGSNTKYQALHKAVQALKHGYSIFIFPEGHTELLEALYKFHTGAVRISFASQAAIQTIVLKDAHRVFMDTFKKNEGAVTIEFGKTFIPDEGYDEGVLFTEDEKVRTKIKARTQELEREVLKHIPVTDMHDQRKEGTDVGVFVDIDLTIYRSLSQMDFLIDLTKKGYIAKSQMLHVAYLFFLEKIHVISHDTLMNEAMHLLSGWNIHTLDKLIRQFFKELALPKLEYGLFAIIEDHLAKKHHVVFVTEVMHPVAEAFVQFFHAEKALDTSLQKRGLTYTGEITLLCRDVAKAHAVTDFIKEHNLDAKKSYAYADSYEDIPFLSLVGHPMAVNPSRTLKKYAKRHKMPILKHH